MSDTDTTQNQLFTLAEVARTMPTSDARFDDGGQYRIEIPSVEGPTTAALVIEQARAEGVPLHRLSQGSGITLLTNGELSEYSAIGAENNVEICLFVGPRAPWDGMSAAVLTPDGRNVGWRHVGIRSLSAALDDVARAAAYGIRSILISDEGLAVLIAQQKAEGALPADLVVKASALMGIANPVGAAHLAATGVDSLNIAGDTPLGELAAFRSATSAFLDLYVEGPDGLGGFLRYGDIGEIVRVAAPVYLKFGLRNAPPMYPSGAHTISVVRNTAIERVHRAAVGLEHLRRQYADAVPSPTTAPRPGIPV